MATAKRRVEIVAFERRRILSLAVQMPCPVCNLASELLTVRQAGALLQVKPKSIRRWLSQGRAHGIRTAGGQHRICKNSLFSK